MSHFTWKASHTVYTMDVQLVKTPAIGLNILQHTQRRLALCGTEQKPFQKRSGCCQLQIPFLSVLLNSEIFISQEFLEQRD